MYCLWIVNFSKTQPTNVMKIGILSPLSAAHPGISLDFMDGLNTFLEANDLKQHIQFVRENIGYGGSEKDVYAKAEKLLINEDVDVLVAYADEKVVSFLQPLLQATNRLLLLVNPGANYPLNWVAQPTIVRLNLQHAFCTWLTGALAAQSDNGHAVYSSTFYDCGYLHGAAMVKSFVSNGGSVRHNYINNQAYDAAFEISQLTNFLTTNSDCNNLLCIFDELPASLFYKLLNPYSGANDLHLFVSPMMLQQKAFATTNEALNFSVEGYAPWLPSITTEENKNFVNSVKRPASIFSLLGWETAMVLSEIFLQKNVDSNDGEAIVAHLKNSSFQSPRGSLQMEDETQTFITAPTRYSFNDGIFTNASTELPNLGNEWKAFTAIPTEGHVTGWTNTYLCY